MIGVFDSGFGGLSIFSRLEDYFEEEDLVYLGDSRRVPYGNRSPGTVIEWTREAVEFLKRSGCQVVLLACHTASNIALNPLKEEYADQDFYIYGVTDPIVRAVCEVAKQRVGVLATRSTVSSNGFLNSIQELRPELKVFQQSAPMLVPLVEEGYAHSPECKRFIRRYLSPLKQKGIDTLLLGCTHFPLLHPLFVKKSGSRIHVPDTALAVATRLRESLKQTNVWDRLERSAKRTILTTDDEELFELIGQRFLGRKFQVNQVHLQ